MRADTFQPSGIDHLAAKFNAAEAFAWALNAAYEEQEGDGGTRFGISREDLRYCWRVAKYAEARWRGALYDELYRRWGKPADIKAAAKLPIPPWQQQLLLDERPKVPLDPSREPHAIPDVPTLGEHWSSPLQHFLAGRRAMLAQLGPSEVPFYRGPAPRVTEQTSFAERSQPPEREDDVEEALERFDRAVDDLGVVDPRPAREREPGEDDDIGEEDPDPQLH